MEGGAQDAVGNGFEVGLRVCLVQEGEVHVSCCVWGEVGLQGEFAVYLPAPVEGAEGCETAEEDGEIRYGHEEGSERL